MQATLLETISESLVPEVCRTPKYYVAVKSLENQSHLYYP